MHEFVKVCIEFSLATANVAYLSVFNYSNFLFNVVLFNLVGEPIDDKSYFNKEKFISM